MRYVPINHMALSEHGKPLSVAGHRLAVFNTDRSFPGLYVLPMGIRLDFGAWGLNGFFFEAVGEIYHNMYEFGGKYRVQSLKFIGPSLGLASVGIMLGWTEDYDFGVNSEYDEHITVKHGYMIINGVKYKAGETCFIPKGTHIVIRCGRNAAYLCLYK